MRSTCSRNASWVQCRSLPFSEGLLPSYHHLSLSFKSFFPVTAQKSEKSRQPASRKSITQRCNPHTIFFPFFLVCPVLLRCSQNMPHFVFRGLSLLLWKKKRAKTDRNKNTLLSPDEGKRDKEDNYDSLCGEYVSWGGEKRKEVAFRPSSFSIGEEEKTLDHPSVRLLIPR